MTPPTSSTGHRPVRTGGDETGAPATTTTTCEICGLESGPFEAAEAAHLAALHDQLHHALPRSA